MSSRHLQVLPNLRSTASKLRRAAAGKENADSNQAANKQSRSKKRRSEKKALGESDENYISHRIEVNCNESCETPKSDKNKIPQTLTCPAAPKKPIRRAGVMNCKRKLMPELEFFEADRREEVDEFFKSSFQRISSSSAANSKRKIASAANSTAVAAESSSSSSPSPPV